MRHTRVWQIAIAGLLAFAGIVCAQDDDFFEFYALEEDSLIQPGTLWRPDVPPDSIANYEMDVVLDVESKRLRGVMQLTWRNATYFPATELQFHLYYNAWRNDKSSFLHSVRYRDKDLSHFTGDDWGYCDIQTMRILPNAQFVGEDITANLEFIQPDDGNPHDRTVARVALRRSVFPGETIRLEITWECKIPRPVECTGVIGDYFFIAQWFPKIGVFENTGLWNCHQFIQTEFYADFGTYDVRLTVPTGWVVGATGREISRVDHPDGTTTHRYYQEKVHDFVWVTTPRFLEFHKQFEEPGLPPVEMRLLLLPYNLDKRDRYFQSAAIALKYYGTWFGPYPYGHLTIVDPAYRSESEGMEYPTLFTGGARWLSPVASRQPESVTIHEAGHQFWYGLVANNEFEHAWLDEGIDTYAQHRIFRHYFPRPPLVQRYFEGFLPLVYSDIFVTNRTDGADRYGGMQSDFKRDPIATPSWKYGPGAYGVNSYTRPALMLQTLENYLGWKTFQEIMATFFQRWQFKHPRPEDFFAVVNEVSGQNLDWFFTEAYYRANVFDYAVGEVYSEPVRPLRGYRELQGELTYQTGKEEKDSNPALQPIESRIYIRRWGEAIFPVEVKFTFENGEEVLEKWDGRERWTVFRFTKPAYLQTVAVDPAHKLVLDVNYTNNTWTRHPARVIAGWKWASKWMIWLQNLMEFLAFFS